MGAGGGEIANLITGIITSYREAHIKFQLFIVKF